MNEVSVILRHYVYNFVLHLPANYTAFDHLCNYKSIDHIVFKQLFSSYLQNYFCDSCLIYNYIKNYKELNPKSSIMSSFFEKIGLPAKSKSLKYNNIIKKKNVNIKIRSKITAYFFISHDSTSGSP